MFRLAAGDIERVVVQTAAGRSEPFSGHLGAKGETIVFLMFVFFVWIFVPSAASACTRRVEAIFCVSTRLLFDDCVFVY